MLAVSQFSVVVDRRDAMDEDGQSVDHGQGVWRVTPSERTEGPPTPGMLREQAVSTEGMWAGYVTTDAGMVSGWHWHDHARPADRP